MKWTMISKPSDTVHVFNLVESGEIKEELRYSPLQQSVRITCQGKQRLFFIEQSRNTHFMLKNEYGFQIGKFSFDNRSSNAGSIEMEGKKIYYAVIDKPLPELVIYEENSLNPLISCGLMKPQNDEYLYSLHSKKQTHEYASLLLGLYWYLFKASEQDVSTEYAKALSFA